MYDQSMYMCVCAPWSQQENLGGAPWTEGCPCSDERVPPQTLAFAYWKIAYHD